MKVFLFATLLFCSKLYCTAQADPAAVLNEIETKLKNKSASISSVLTDKNYQAFHPETSFRELIKKYAATDPVQIAADEEPGRKIKIIATLKDDEGKSIAGAVVYFYQTDARGWYAAEKPHVGGNSGDQRHARLFGYAKTDALGKFEIHTVKPSGYPQSDLPAHIHVEVLNHENYVTRITEFLFDDDERLVGTIRANSQGQGFILAKPEKADPPFQQQFSYNIVLQMD